MVTPGSIQTEILGAADPTVPVVGGAVAIVLFLGVAVFARIKKRWADFRQIVHQHGFTVPEKLPGFVDRWRTLATRIEGARTFEIREELVHRPENEDLFQELTAHLPATTGLEFLIRRKSRWRKLEPVGDARAVELGIPEFDEHWFMETNQPETMRGAITPPLQAHFSNLAATSGIESLTLKGKDIAIRDDARFLPAERFEHALHLLLALAAVAEKK